MKRQTVMAMACGIVFGVCGLTLSDDAHAISPDTQDAVAIMKAVDAQPEPRTSSSRTTLKVVDRQGHERVRVVRSTSMKFAEGTKQLMLFESPADVRNTGLLSVDYDAGSKEDDQWLYLPSLKKSTRIAGGDKSGSFMGTDLTYSDMTRQDPADYDYSLVKGSSPVGGEDCWQIEARPKTDKVKKETGYIKSHYWISKSKLMLVQSKMWVKKGKKLKYVKFGNMEKHDGIWMVRKISARTKRNKQVESTTVISIDDLKVNTDGLTDQDFSQRRLEQGL